MREKALVPPALAAMLISGVLAPLFFWPVWVGSTMPLPDNPRPYTPPGLVEHILAVLSGLPAAWIGRRALLRGAREGWLLWRSAVAGIQFLAVVCTGLVFHGPEAVLVFVLGLLVAMPMGLCFGVLFAMALVGNWSRNEATSYDGPARAAVASAVPLIIASGLVVWWSGLMMEPTYQVTLHAALGLLTVSAAALLAWGLFELVRIRTLRRTILAGTHPDYIVGESLPSANSIPLTRSDQRASKQASVMHRASTAYRDKALNVHVAR